jgi:hypothetical protein
MNALDKAPIPQNDLARLLEHIERLEAIFADWEETPRRAADAITRITVSRPSQLAVTTSPA